MRRGNRWLPVAESLEGRSLQAVMAAPIVAASSPGTVEVGRNGGTRFLAVQYQAAGGRTERMDLYLPTTPAPPGGRGAVLGFPGGGWREANRPYLGAQMAALAKKGYVAASVDVAYASDKSGTRIWPLNFEDARQAVRWIRSHAANYGINPDKIAVLGQSAGGNLASLLGTWPDDPIRPDGLPGPDSGASPAVSSRVQAVIDMYGPADLTALYAQGGKVTSYLDTFLGGSPATAPGRYQAASPIRHVSADDPPFLILQGSGDPTVRVSQATNFGAALKAAGVPVKTVIYPGVGHGFEIVGKRRNSLPAILDFLDRAFNQGGAGI